MPKLTGLTDEEYTKAKINKGLAVVTRYVEKGTNYDVLRWLGDRLTHLAGKCQARLKEDTTSRRIVKGSQS